FWARLRQTVARSCGHTFSIRGYCLRYSHSNLHKIRTDDAILAPTPLLEAGWTVGNTPIVPYSHLVSQDWRPSRHVRLGHDLSQHTTNLNPPRGRSGAVCPQRWGHLREEVSANQRWFFAFGGLTHTFAISFPRAPAGRAKPKHCDSRGNRLFPGFRKR